MNLVLLFYRINKWISGFKSTVSFCLYFLIWLSLWRLVSGSSALLLLSLFSSLLKSFFWYNCSIHLFEYYQVSQLWYKLKAGNHYEYYLSYVVNFMMRWLSSILPLVSHLYKQSAVSEILEAFFIQLAFCCFLLLKHEKL